MLPQDLDYAGVRLRLITSRLVEDADENDHNHDHGHGHGHKSHGRRHGRRETHRHAHSDMEPVIVHDDKTRRPIKGYKDLDVPVFRKVS